MKKSVCVLLAGISLVGMSIFSGCGNSVPFSAETKKLKHNRYNVVATVDSKVSSEDMENISKKVVDDTLKEHPDAHGIYINITDAPEGISYTLNQYEYGPAGSAGYDPRNSKQEKSLKLVRDRSQKDWSTRPSSKEYEIYNKYTSFLLAHPGTSEKDFLMQATDLKLSVEELDAVEKKVVAWMMH